jgi:hypothetical protein
MFLLHVQALSCSHVFVCTWLCLGFLVAKMLGFLCEELVSYKPWLVGHFLHFLSTFCLASKMRHPLLCLGVSASLCLVAWCLEGPCVEQCTISCSFPSSERLSPICNCDADCAVFNDCCGGGAAPSRCPPPNFPPLQLGAVLECRPVYLVGDIHVEGPEDAVFMVSSCPRSWPLGVCYEGSVHSKPL